MEGETGEGEGTGAIGFLSKPRMTDEEIQAAKAFHYLLLSATEDYACFAARIELCQRTIDYLRMEHHITGRQMTLAEEKQLGIGKLQDTIKMAVEEQGKLIVMVAEKVKGE